MTTSHEFLGSLSSVLTVIAYAPYLFSIIRGKTRPHLFSWIIWSILPAIVFCAQYIKDAGAGAWMTGITAILSFVVTILAARQGDKYIKPSDWVVLGIALSAIPLWYFTNDPLGAVILSLAINGLGSYPTILKCYNKPHEEMASLYGICAFRCVLALMAIDLWIATNYLYPFVMGAVNLLITGIILRRRSILRKQS
jgi:hypothetical protein